MTHMLTRGEMIGAGYLQEVNRTFAGPLGLMFRAAPGPDALRAALVVEDHRREALDATVLDLGLLAAEKAQRVAAESAARRETRIRLWGSAVQPVPDAYDGIAVQLADEDATFAALADHAARVAEGLAQRIAEDAAAAPLDPVILGQSLARALLGEAIGPLLAALDVLPGGVIRIARDVAAPTEAPTPDMAMDRRARAAFLAAEVPRLQGEHGQLYAEEEPEVARLAAVVAGWPAEPDETELAEVLARLEDLHANAQQGMRFWRGDRSARARWNDVRDRVADQINAFAASRPEIDRFLAGGISAVELVAPDVVRQEVEQRIEALSGQRYQIEAELTAVATAEAPLRAALERLAEVGR